MDRNLGGWAALVVASMFLATGCNSPYHSDRGALFGGLTGAGVGALVGHATGHTGAGAAIGAGVGALTGAAVGSGLDEIEAKNRAQIEARLGRPVGPGAVTVGEAVTMTQSRVPDEVIVNHIHSHGAVPLTTDDLVTLQNAGVSGRVVRAMQAPPPPNVVAGPPVIVEERYVAPPPYYYGHYYRRRPGVSWGISVRD